MDRAIESTFEQENMIPKHILDEIQRQQNVHSRDYRLKPERVKEVKSIFAKMDIPENSEIFEFCTSFSPDDLDRHDGVHEELLDPVFGTQDEEWEFWQYALKLSPDFIPLTSAEGEGALLWSKRDGKVYDIGWPEAPALNNDEVAARWDSYYGLIEFYIFGKEGRAESQ